MKQAGAVIIKGAEKFKTDEPEKKIRNTRKGKTERPHKKNR